MQHINHMICYASASKDSIKGKNLVIPGAVIVAQHAAGKVFECGGIVVSLPDSTEIVISNDEKCITPKDVAYYCWVEVQWV